MKKSIFLFFAVLLCATSAWAGPTFNGGYIYFHNKGNWSDNSKQLCIGRDQWENDWTETRIMTVVKNTQLWTNALPTSGWGDATYMGVIGNASDWDSQKWGSGNLKNANHRTAAVALGDWGFNNNSCQMLIPASGNNDASLSLTWIGSSVDAMNKTITVKAKTSNDGKTYSVAMSPGTLQASSFEFTAYNSCSSITALSSNKITCGYTATTKLTAQTNVSGYVFMGWYDKDGNLQTENATLTIYPTADAEYYAYYKKPLTYTVTVPVGTEKCYIVGGWDWNTFKEMTPTANTNEYTITIDKATATQGYKYTCGTDWKYVEVNANGDGINDRGYNANDIVARWNCAPGIHLVGDMNNWNTAANKFQESGTTATVTLTLTPGDYKFKVQNDNGEWLGNTGTMVRGGTAVHEGGWLFESGKDPCIITIDIAGNYTFTWTNNKLTVTYPKFPDLSGQPNPIYFQPSEAWKSNNARFAAYYFQGETPSERWVDLTDIDRDGIYEFNNDKKFISVIIVRMNPDNNENRWNTDEENNSAYKPVWNKTENLVIPTDGKNWFIMDGNEWENTGQWSTYPPTIKIGEGDNTAALATGGTVNAEVTRQFISGNLYTIALPFTLENVSSVFGAQAYEYTSLAKDGEEVVLYFNKVNTLEPGKPYLIEPTQDVPGFTAENVTISNATNNIAFTAGKTTVTMIPVLSVVANAKTDGKYWLAADRYLYNSENDLPSLRALFEITTVSGMPPRARVAFGENAATGLDNITNGENTTIKVIENGQLFIIRNGEKFNAMGQRL